MIFYGFGEKLYFDYIMNYNIWISIWKNSKNCPTDPRDQNKIPQKNYKTFEKYRTKTEIDGIYYNNFNVRYFRNLLETAVSEQKNIDKLVNKTLMETWKLPRIDPTVRAIFRIASSELIIKAAPEKVIINEYLKLSEAFSINDKQNGIVNAVLESLVKHYT